MKSNIPTFEQWWKTDGSKVFSEEAKEAARYTWNYSWNKASEEISKLNRE